MRNKDRIFEDIRQTEIVNLISDIVRRLAFRMTALAQETVNKLLDFNQKLDIALLVSDE